MIKREADFTIYFRHWLKAHSPFMPCAFELKQTRTNSISFSAVKEHQLDALFAAYSGENGLLYKIPDDSRGIKPFDMVFMYRIQAFVVIKYPDFFVMISVGRFVTEKGISRKKSLTAERAQAIADIVVPIKASAKGLRSLGVFQPKNK